MILWMRLASVAMGLLTRENWSWYLGNAGGPPKGMRHGTTTRNGFATYNLPTRHDNDTNVSKCSACHYHQDAASACHSAQASTSKRRHACLPPRCQ